jgi:hypothetical protein
MKRLNSLLILSIIIGLFSSYSFGQDSENSKTKEIYLSSNILSFNNLGLQYKSELKKGSFFRIGLNNINSDLTKQNYGALSAIPRTTTNFAVKFEVGLEKRKQITEKLSAFYGINFITETSFQRIKREDPTLPRNLRHLDNFSINPGFGFNSGFILKITGAFSVSAEIIPELVYNYSSSESIVGAAKVKDTRNGGSIKLGNESVRVSLIYQWNKK